MLQSRGGGADLLRNAQHPERTERRFGVGVKRDGAGQYGCRGVSRDYIYGRHLYLGIGRIQGRRDVGAEPTPRRRHAVIPGLPQRCGRGDTPVWRERHCVPTGDGGEALVHRRILPGAGRGGPDSGRGNDGE